MRSGEGILGIGEVGGLAVVVMVVTTSCRDTCLCPLQSSESTFKGLELGPLSWLQGRPTTPGLQSKSTTKRACWAFGHCPVPPVYLLPGHQIPLTFQPCAEAFPPSKQIVGTKLVLTLLKSPQRPQGFATIKFPLSGLWCWLWLCLPVPPMQLIWMCTRRLHFIKRKKCKCSAANYKTLLLKKGGRGGGEWRANINSSCLGRLVV